MATLPEQYYKISEAAWEKLCTEAREAEHNAFWWFRHLAGALARSRSPVFKLSGENTYRTLKVYLPEVILGKLERLCDRLGVPVAAIGELVCCFVEEAV